MTGAERQLAEIGIGTGERHGHVELAMQNQSGKTLGAMRLCHHFFCSLATIVIGAMSPGVLCAQSPSPIPSQTASAKSTMTTQHAKGTFEVTVKPVATTDAEDADRVKRMMLNKQFSGDLTGTGKGEMLASGTPDGSGAYVAIEQVTGTLGGRKGSFVFQHSGTMTKGAVQLTITVVPDSGTGELAGLAGTFMINVVEGKHLYDFE